MSIKSTSPARDGARQQSQHHVQGAANIANPASTQDFNKTRAGFMQRLTNPSVPPLAFKLGYLIVYRYANHKTQLCYPSQTTLAADLGASIRTVQRLLDILERHGLVIVPGDGRGKSSRYWIDPQRVSPMSSFPGRKGDKKGRHPTTKKGDTAVSPEPSKRTKIEEGECYALPLPPGERDRASRDEDYSCDRGGALDAPARSGLDPTEIIPPPNQSKKSGEEEIEIADGAEADPWIDEAAERRDRSDTSLPIVPLDQERAFRELLALWDRGHVSDHTPKAIAITWQAFAKACTFADPADILAKAQEHVAAADAPRFLPALPQWLTAHGWEKPPPAKAKRASHSKRGNNGYQRKGGKKDLTRIALKMGGYVEDEDGELYHPDGDDGCSFDWRASQ